MEEGERKGCHNPLAEESEILCTLLENARATLAHLSQLRSLSDTVAIVLHKRCVYMCIMYMCA